MSPDLPNSTITEPANPSQLAILRHFAGLYLEAKRLKDELDVIEKQMANMQSTLLDFFPNGPDDKHTVDGVTIFMRSDLYARSKEGGAEGTEAVCQALHATGLSHFCHETFSVQTLSAHVRELERLNAERLKSGEVEDIAALLPPLLAQVLNVNRTYRVMGTPARRE